MGDPVQICINLFNTYFNIELNSHTDTEWSIEVEGWYSPDMELAWHWSIYQIFQHWIKKNKINFPHRKIFHIFYERVSFCFRNTNKSFLAGCRHFPNDNLQLSRSDVIWLTRGLISWMLSEYCPDICPCTDIALVALLLFTYGQNWCYYL